MEELSIHNIISNYGLYSGTFVICIISGFVPIVNAEIFLIIISPMVTKSLFLPVLLLATIGQMIAKTVLFLSGMGVIKLSLRRFENKIDETLVKIHQWGAKVDIFIFLSAFTGFPPFYIITIVSGMIRHNFYRFFLCGTCGRALRFGIIMLFPHIFKQLFL